MADNNTPDALVRFDSPDFGKSLIDRARTLDHAQRSRRVLQDVQIILEKIRGYERSQETIATCLNVLNLRLAALEANAFTLDSHDRIVFHDATLNQTSFETPAGTHTI